MSNGGQTAAVGIIAAKLCFSRFIHSQSMRLRPCPLPLRPPPSTASSAARSGPRFGAYWFLLLAGYENLTAPNAIMQS
jgi:hypothetical protein